MVSFLRKLVFVLKGIFIDFWRFFFTWFQSDVFKVLMSTYLGTKHESLCTCCSVRQFITKQLRQD